MASKKLFIILFLQKGEFCPLRNFSDSYNNMFGCVLPRALTIKTGAVTLQRILHSARGKILNIRANEGIRVKLEREETLDTLIRKSWLGSQP